MKYDEVRASQRSGHSRTQAMTEIIGQMLPLVAHLPDDFPLDQPLQAKGGQLLQAYTYLYAHPGRATRDPRAIDALVASLRDRNRGDGEFRARPFEQYWGILALDRLIRAAGPENVNRDLRSDLERLQMDLDPNGDRHSALSRILRPWSSVAPTRNERSRADTLGRETPFVLCRRCPRRKRAVRGLLIGFDRR